MEKRKGSLSTFLVIVIALILAGGAAWLGMSAYSGMSVSKGEKYLAAEDYRSALEAFKKADKYNILRKDVRITEGLAESYFGLEDYDPALHYYSLVVAASPENAKARYRLGLLYIRAKEYKKAEEQAKELRAMNKGDADRYADDLTEKMQEGMVKGFFKGLFEKILPSLPKIPGLTDGDTGKDSPEHGLSGDTEPDAYKQDI